MTIASEIQRLQWAKSSARTSIINKWVNVPVSAKLDTYHTYIDQIAQWWWVKWIIWWNPVRVFWVSTWSNQTPWSLTSQPLSYHTWDYLFIITDITWYTNNNYQRIDPKFYVWSSNFSDYKSVTNELSAWGSSEDSNFCWFRISISWNDALCEAVYRRWVSPYGSSYDKYYYYYACTFNMSTNTRWNWTTATSWATSTNPYFEWLINDQWLYTWDTEAAWNYAKIIKFTPTFS